MEEAEAIARLKQGDVGGLEALVRGHQVQAVRTAYLITRDRALAEDVVQAAFVRAYERVGQFDSERPFDPGSAPGGRVERVCVTYQRVRPASHPG